MSDKPLTFWAYYRKKFLRYHVLSTVILILACVPPFVVNPEDPAFVALRTVALAFCLMWVVTQVAIFASVVDAWNTILDYERYLDEGHDQI